MSSYRDFVSVPVAHGIMFHHFHGLGHPQVQGSLDAGQLVDMLDFMKKSHRILDPQLWIEKALEARLETDDLCLTFDDGLLSQYEVAVPVLRDLGYTGFFFVYSSVFEGGIEQLEVYRTFRTVHFRSVDDFYEQFFYCVEVSDYGDVYKSKMGSFPSDQYLAEFPFYTTEDRRFRFVRDKILGPMAYREVMDSMIQGKDLTYEALAQGLWMDHQKLLDLSSTGHVVGLHSYTHPTVLSDFSSAEQLQEYKSNAEHLRTQLGKTPIAMAHPCNSYDGETLRILSDLGILVGFRANMSQPYRLGLEHPREDHANILRMMKRVGV